MNDLFVYASPIGGEQYISIGIGSRDHQRRKKLSENEALKLAHKLMSYARGGSTDGQVLSLEEL